MRVFEAAQSVTYQLIQLLIKLANVSSSSRHLIKLHIWVARCKLEAHISCVLPTASKNKLHYLK